MGAAVAKPKTQVMAAVMVKTGLRPMRLARGPKTSVQIMAPAKTMLVMLAV